MLSALEWEEAFLQSLLDAEIQYEVLHTEACLREEFFYMDLLNIDRDWLAIFWNMTFIFFQKYWEWNGVIIPIDELVHLFQRGLFNHQPGEREEAFEAGEFQIQNDEDEEDEDVFQFDFMLWLGELLFPESCFTREK